MGSIGHDKTKRGKALINARWLALHALSCAVIFSFFGCESKIIVDKKLASKTAASATSLKPITAMPGDIVSVTGTGFKSGQENLVKITAASGDEVTVPVTVISDSAATFVMPEGAGLGLTSVVLESNGKQVTGAMGFVANLASNTLPIIIDDASEICSTKQYIDKNGDTQTGTKNCYGSSADLTNLTAGNIKSGVTINGVTGSVTPAPANCAADGATNCVAVDSFPAALASGAASKLLSGQTLAGVSGNVMLPAVGKVLTGTAFGVGGIGSTGTYSVTAPDPWDIRFGTTVNGISGKLKTACRNAVNSTKYNFDGSLSGLGDAAITSGSIADVWDTVDDWNNSGAVPSALPSGWDNYLCGGVETSAGDDKVWKDVTTAGCSSSTSQCRFKDKISRLEFSALPISDIFGASTSNGSTTVTVDSTLHLFTGMVISEMSGNIPSGATITSITSGTTFELSVPATATDSDLILTVNAMTWSAAVKYCDALTWDGQSDWRLPTQKEFFGAFNHGFRSAVLSAPNWMTSNNMSMWTATNYSWAGGSAWIVNPGYGGMSASGKGNELPVICVR